MLTAIEVIKLSSGIQAASYKTVDNYLYVKLGFDYKEWEIYAELKEAIEAVMFMEEVHHPAGYTIYEWHDK